MTGEIRSVDGRGCRGWARLPDVPKYPVIVHLIVDDLVRASTLADRVCDDDQDPSFDEEGWFVLGVPEEFVERRSDLRVLVGESGEFLRDPALAPVFGLDTTTKRGGEESFPVSPGSNATYRDALANGASAADILILLYFDILKRPIDNAGLTDNLTRLTRGAISIDNVRKSLLESAEYARLSLTTTAAPGCIFSRPLLTRSSEQRQKFERYADVFQRLSSPIGERLLRFFPGLLLRPSLLEQIEAAAVRGIPARELFCRALSFLSDKPALILGNLPEPLPPSAWTLLNDGEREVVVPPTSPLFALGWHLAEGLEGVFFRWMTQVGVILNPCPQKPVERVDIVVGGWLDGLNATVAVASERDRLALTRYQIEDGSWILSVTSGQQGNIFDYIVLVAVDATCPYRQNGSPDPRLLSLNVRRAMFVFEE